MTKYEGSPCKKCGETVRYISSKRCVACQAKDNENRYNAMKSELKELRKQLAAINQEVYTAIQTGNY